MLLQKMEKQMFNTVLVTGGSGFVGKNLQHEKPDWIYISSKDYNLLDREECTKMFEEHKPDAVIHLAAKVAGIKSNAEEQASFLYENCMINLNVVECAYKAGVTRLIAAMSTCAFPSTLPEYPFEESSVFDGPPPETNLSYGYAKRLLHVQCLSYRKQYGVNYSTFSPSNLYGLEDNFGTESSHFVAALIKKVYEASDGDVVEFWGTGETLKQELYIGDLCKIIPVLLENHNSSLPMIISPDEHLSISEMIQILLGAVGKNITVQFTGYLDGQYRKDGSNKELLKLVPDFEFTLFKEGVLRTYNWYVNL